MFNDSARIVHRLHEYNNLNKLHSYFTAPKLLKYYFYSYMLNIRLTSIV